MTRSEVIRQLERVSANDVYVVIAAFFASDPPPSEVVAVVQLIQDQARAFDAVLSTHTPAPAPEPQKQEAENG